MLITDVGINSAVYEASGRREFWHIDIRLIHSDNYMLQMAPYADMADYHFQAYYIYNPEIILKWLYDGFAGD